jgi:hypothetical protein
VACLCPLHCTLCQGLRPKAILRWMGHGKACFEVSDGGEDGGKRTVGVLSWRQDWIWTAWVGASTWMTRRPQGCQSRRVEWSGSGFLLLVEGGRSTPCLWGRLQGLPKAELAGELWAELLGGCCVWLSGGRPSGVSQFGAVFVPASSWVMWPSYESREWYGRCQMWLRARVELGLQRSGEWKPTRSVWSLFGGVPVGVAGRCTGRRTVRILDRGALLLAWGKSGANASTSAGVCVGNVEKRLGRVQREALWWSFRSPG